jgi:cytochrome b561
MLRTDGDPELRVFDQGIRFLHWLTLFLVATIFVLAFSIGSHRLTRRPLRSSSCIARLA